MRMRAVESQVISNNQRKSVKVRNQVWDAGTVALKVVARMDARPQSCYPPPGDESLATASSSPKKAGAMHWSCFRSHPGPAHPPEQKTITSSYLGRSP